MSYRRRCSSGPTCHPPYGPARGRLIPTRARPRGSTGRTLPAPLPCSRLVCLLIQNKPKPIRLLPCSRHRTRTPISRPRSMAAVSGHDAVAEEDFTERELEVAAILADLPSIVRAQRRRQRRLEQQQQQQRPEIPTWGRRRPRKALAALPPAAEKPAAVIPAAVEDDHRREGAASPDTPLAFPDDHHHEEETGDKKAAAQEEWAQQQRGVVASLSHENAHLLKQIEEFRARLETSRSTNDSLNQMQQSKHKKRYRPPSSEEEEQRRPKLQARIVAAVADRPALDLNEPADADAEEAKPQTVAAQWFHRGHQHLQLMRQKAALTAAARRRRREIRRAKGASSASRTRRVG